ncbi:MAG: aminotransferase class IV [Actinobacteria bacterium]|nr:aminotransferase class IV [Actinomycetota bacterium]
MVEYIFIDGKLYQENRAKISVNDRGLLFGDGVYETMRSYGGRVFMLEAHLKRLFDSLKALKFNIPFDKKYLGESIKESLNKNGLGSTDAYIKIVVTRGIHKSGLYLDCGSRPTMLIFTRKLQLYRPELYSEGAEIISSSIRRLSRGNSIYIHKSICFLENLIAKDEAKMSGALEGFFMTRERQVLEGASSNIFMVRDGTVYTPPLTQNILPGITRQAVLGICSRNGIRSREKSFYYGDLTGASEIFLTNSIMEIMPVRKVDNTWIGQTVPGIITRKLMGLFKDYTGENSSF